jgi:hypothetical protein
MKTFDEFLQENQVFNDYITWEANAKSRGHDVKKLTHPTGVGHHFVAKDKEGNPRGHYDPQKNSGKLYEAHKVEYYVSKKGDKTPHGNRYFDSKEEAEEWLKDQQLKKSAYEVVQSAKLDLSMIKAKD